MLTPWEEFQPHLDAREMWDKKTKDLSAEELEEMGPFEGSSLFRHARLAYRRYTNASPDSETT